MKRIVIGFLTLVLAISFGCGTGNTGASAADFFKSNMVTLHVNAAAGGTTDIGARIFAKYWTQVTGGSMQVIDHPGGGGEEGFDYVHTAAPDGLNIGTTMIVADIYMPHIVGIGGVNWDGREMSYIGADQYTPGVFALAVDRPFKTPADLQGAKNIRFGATSPGSAFQLSASFILDAFKMDGKVITGYESTELGVACKRSELDGYALAAPNILKDAQNGYVKPLFSLTTEQCVWTPDALPMPKVVQLDADHMKILQTIQSLNQCKAFFAPPKLPADKLEFFRRTFDKINAMPEFVTDLKPTYPFWDPSLTGEKLTEQVNQVLSGPANDPTLKALVAKYQAIK